jgi:acetate kinase
MYCYDITKRIGAYAAALGGVETLVFSGGIGEHASVIRARVCGGLAFLGIDLDPQRNAIDAPVISAQHARVTVRVIPTDEETTIAEEACRLLA